MDYWVILGVIYFPQARWKNMVVRWGVGGGYEGCLQGCSTEIRSGLLYRS